MMKCPECGAQQLEGVLFCDECGRFLAEKDTGQQTDVLPFTHIITRPLTAPINPDSLQNRSQPVTLTLFVAHNRSRLSFTTSGQLHIGRADYETGHIPEINLTDYKGAEMGVSRTHATLWATDQGLVVIDTNSTNGTWLNGNRLSPKRPYSLKSGDELQLGDLLMHVFVDTETNSA